MIGDIKDKALKSSLTVIGNGLDKRFLEGVSTLRRKSSGLLCGDRGNCCLDLLWNNHSFMCALEIHGFTNSNIHKKLYSCIIFSPEDQSIQLELEKSHGRALNFLKCVVNNTDTTTLYHYTGLE